MKKDREYYEGLDKRTNEYKEWKAGLHSTEGIEPKEPIGLGDVVEKITKATGIKSAVKWLNGGEDCGACEERKRKLNELRFRRKPLPLNEVEYEYLKELYESGRSVSRPTLERLVEIECRLFSKRYSGPICGNCGDAQRIIKDMKEIYKAYEES
jgi:hypothetical protein